MSSGCQKSWAVTCRTLTDLFQRIGTRRAIEHRVSRTVSLQYVIHEAKAITLTLGQARRKDLAIYSNAVDNRCMHCVNQHCDHLQARIKIESRNVLDQLAA